MAGAAASTVREHNSTKTTEHALTRPSGRATLLEQEDAMSKDKNDNEILTEMREGFAKMDARFEQVDARFEQVDARFEQVDARFEQVDARQSAFEEHMAAIAERTHGLERSDITTHERLCTVETKFTELSEQMSVGFAALSLAQERSTTAILDQLIAISGPLLRVADNMEQAYEADQRRDRQLVNHERRIRALEDDEEAG